MDSAQIVLNNILRLPVWTCGCMFSFVFSWSASWWQMVRWLWRRDKGFSLGEKHSERHCYHFHVGLVGKRLTNGHRLMVYEREPWQRQRSICTLVQLVAGFTHCLWSLIIHSAWDGLYIPPCLSLTSLMEVISLAVTFCFSVVSLDSLSIFN